jgi:hypothetical protein
LGYGKKADIVNHDLHIPGPDRYTLQSDFEKNQNKNLGISFGQGREVPYINSRKCRGEFTARI